MNDDASQSNPLSQAAAPKPAPSTNCIELELNEINRQLAMADRLKEYKTALEDLLAKTTSAMEEYTYQKYRVLLQRWKDEDKAIGDLLGKMHCAVPNLEKVFGDSVCPVFTAIADLRRALAPAQPAPTPKPGKDDGLYRLRDWQQRQYDIAQQNYQDAIKALAAWEKPAQTIDKALTDNAKLVADINKGLGQPDPAVLAYDMFVKVLPMHWMIGPPANRPAPGSARDPAYYLNCGEATNAWRQVKAMIGPQPALIQPTDYFNQICGDVLKTYNDAKQAFAAADGELKQTLEEIKRTEKSLDDKVKSLEKDAKAALLAASKKMSDEPAPKGYGSDQTQPSERRTYTEDRRSNKVAVPG